MVASPSINGMRKMIHSYGGGFLLVLSSTRDHSYHARSTTEIATRRLSKVKTFVDLMTSIDVKSCKKLHGCIC
ncbi:hypothetical protein EUGRSUZ_E01143 [Eucalyptus grandis]|uniref:Uncharacterized protein n=2 Tax=Eucalyptus grandis TaxID=71139 RepID=A0ACC3KUE4_EUCGR|nr:hypothetical protein EUGRSUZ_E01143 [Eucalyptus grandis]